MTLCKLLKLLRRLLLVVLIPVLKSEKLILIGIVVLSLRLILKSLPPSVQLLQVVLPMKLGVLLLTPLIPSQQIRVVELLLTLRSSAWVKEVTNIV